MFFGIEQQITHGPGGRILTNCNVWSPDGQWIVYDTRSDAEGAVFDGTAIETVHVGTGVKRRVYESRRGACCGVATFHPQADRVVFILGPEDPTPDWSYGPSHRQGVLVDVSAPDGAVALDARDLTARTPGALRGGSHVHVFSPDGAWVSFTYNDALLADFAGQRNVGVCAPPGPVRVPGDNPRSHDGTLFSVLATRTTARPRFGSDDILQALEDGWVGRHGYRRADGTWQRRALAFQGQVLGADGMPFWEVFVVDLPDDVTVPAPDGPLQGTLTRRPCPPLGTAQRRLTRTEHREHRGICGPRHWLRTSPDGTRIAFLMRDDAGIGQLWTVSPLGGVPRQVTRDPWPVASAFTWHPGGHEIAYAADNSVFVADAQSGLSRRLTARTGDADAPSPLACVFSLDGSQIAFLRRLADVPGPDAPRSNQICVVTNEVPASALDRNPGLRQSESGSPLSRTEEGRGAVSSS